LSGSDVHPIAIVGMACIFPGAGNLETFWHNNHNAVDAITDVPTHRVEAGFFGNDSDSIDRFACRRGGFVDAFAKFDPVAFGIMPKAAEGAEPDQLLALRVASEALEDAGLTNEGFSKKGVAVILGRGGYMTPGMTRLVQKVRTANQIVDVLKAVVPDLRGDQLQSIKHAFQQQGLPLGPDTAIGLVPNLAASRIANRLDLHGPAYTIDAACASSLLAVDQACRELESGRCHLAIAGGVHLCHDVAFWSVFHQLGVLSRQQVCRPFDVRADGLLMGEGVGMVVLKSAAAAIRDKNRIYAMIRGTGVSSDGRQSSLMQPNAEGQSRALARAWQTAGLDPKTVGFIEAHGTGTQAGDAAELATLRDFFGPASNENRAGLGSVKSMIGHCMPAAGVAGLIRAAMACYHGLLPPTLHCDEPQPDLELTRFRPIVEAEVWEQNVRRAGVNAFGFGGINAHVVLEYKIQSSQGRSRRKAPQKVKSAAKALFLSAPSFEALLQDLETGRQVRLNNGPVRLAIVEPDDKQLALAKKIVSKGKAWRGRKGLWFTPQGLLNKQSKIAFMFPGVDATFQPRVQDVAEHFQWSLPAGIQVQTEVKDIEHTGLGIVAVNRLLHRAAQTLGIQADAMIGHSVGEWSGMIASGMIPQRAANTLIDGLRPGTLEVPGVSFLAAGCGRERADRIIQDLDQIAISHDNCPHQVILCGWTDSIETTMDRLKNDGILCQMLPFKSGFHSPLFKDYIDPHKKRFSQLELVSPTIPLWSATTCEPYPDQADEIRVLAVDHMIKPVLFRQLVERLYTDNYRVFLQLGTGSLPGFVNDTLGDREHLALSANMPNKSGMDQLRQMAAALFVEGSQFDLSQLFELPKRSESSMELRLGTPLIQLDSSVVPTASTASTEPIEQSDDPILNELLALQQDLLQSNRAIAHAWKERKLGSRPTVAQNITQKRTLSVHTVPALRDHSFFPQPKGWPVVADGHPVVPMTMLITMMMELAGQAIPGRVVTEVKNVRAMRWLVVDPPIEVTLRAEPLRDEWIKVVIEEYAEAELKLAAAYPVAVDTKHGANNRRELINPRATEITAKDLYADRWMFHGPDYQGVLEMGLIGDNGIQGVLSVTEGPGALLDNAGQLYGYWVMAVNRMDRLAMPVRIARLEFFGPDPGIGEHLNCHVWIQSMTDLEVQADLELYKHDKCWCRITGWDDRRFESDPRVWMVLRQSDKHLLSDVRPQGYLIYDDRKRRTPSRDWMGRRYLGEAERKTMMASGPKRARQWLHGRIVAKDAVRNHLWENGSSPIFPVEISIGQEPQGAPFVQGPFESDLRISISHSGDMSVASVAEGVNVGIDLERIETRPDSFLDIVLTDREKKLLRGREKDEWVTRMWCAKEAVAKAHKIGLGGSPKRFEIGEIDGDRIYVNGTWVQTALEEAHVVAWTEV